jgi:hypothetical protein
MKVKNEGATWGKIIIMRCITIVTLIYGLGVGGMLYLAAYTQGGFENLHHVKTGTIITLILITITFFLGRKLFRTEKEYFGD